MVPALVAPLAGHPRPAHPSPPGIPPDVAKAPRDRCRRRSRRSARTLAPFSEFVCQASRSHQVGFLADGQRAQRAPPAAVRRVSPRRLRRPSDAPTAWSTCCVWKYGYPAGAGSSRSGPPGCAVRVGAHPAARRPLPPHLRGVQRTLAHLHHAASHLFGPRNLCSWPYVLKMGELVQEMLRRRPRGGVVWRKAV